MLQVKFTLLDGAIAPTRGTAISAGWDLYARKDYRISEGDLCLVDTGVIARAPKGYHFKVVIRSGALRKKGLTLGNAVGIIDEDYCGPSDIIYIPVFKLPIKRFNHGTERPKGTTIGMRSELFKVNDGTRLVDATNWFSDYVTKPITIEKGERIAQLLVEPVSEVAWERGTDISKADRGGFGSSGEK